MCSDHIPENAEVVFLGGANDDLMYTGSGFTILPRLIAFVRFSEIPIAPERWEPTLDLFSADILTHADQQMADIRAGLSCLALRGDHFTMLHDFLVSDLRGSRSDSRNELMARRRDTVLASGGNFVDLRKEFATRAGVSWFNDFVHLSSIGHGNVAALICSMTSAVKGAPADTPGGPNAGAR